MYMYTVYVYAILSQEFILYTEIMCTPILYCIVSWLLQKLCTHYGACRNVHIVGEAALCTLKAAQTHKEHLMQDNGEGGRDYSTCAML